MISFKMCHFTLDFGGKCMKKIHLFMKNLHFFKDP